MHRLFSLLGEKYCDVRDLELFSSGVAAYLKHTRWISVYVKSKSV